MKFLSALGLALFSLSSFAFEKTADLDLSSLYSGFNAGKYEVSVSFASKQTPSLSKLETRMNRFDNDYTCTTFAKFDLGQMKLSIKSVDGKWNKTLLKNLVGTIEHDSADENCSTSFAPFAGNKRLHVQLALDPVVLPVTPFPGYELTQVWATPFRGYLQLEGVIEVKDNSLSLDPSSLLTEESVLHENSGNAVLGYYVQARVEATSLSLAVDAVDFK